jgi:hypothetical protein
MTEQNKQLEDQEVLADLEEQKYKKAMEQEDDEDEDDEDDDEEENGKKMKMKEMKHKKMKEDLDSEVDSIFSGEGLSEEFKSNAKAIFEAAVLAKVDERAQQLEEEYSQKLDEEIASINENLVNKVDEYLEYVVSEWLEENKLAVESGIKAEIAEDFMVGLKNLFTEHYIDIPEDKVDLVEQFSTKVEELETELDKAIGENKSLSEEIKSYKKTQIMSEVSEGLTDVQFAKFESLAENVEFVSEEDYKAKLALTKKKYFQINEEVETTKSDLISDEVGDTQEYSPIMEKYVKNISKIIRK